MVDIKYALDTLFFLLSGALVMWMAAGFSMLEAGLVRSKNTTEILTKNIALYAIACVMYLLVGYQMMYSSDAGGWLPSLGALIGNEHSVEAIKAGEADHSLYSDFFFQAVFVATAMSVVSGAVAERMKLVSFLIFAVVMTGFIYPVSGYWLWGGGFLKTMGFADFAGSGLVHLIGACAALTGAFILGPRFGRYTKTGQVKAIPGANMPLATIGTFILWMGWFGFNGGSQLMISDIDNANAVSKIFVNTNTAAAGGVIAALILTKLKYGKFDLSMVLNGALAGLVAITAEPLTPSPIQATVIGIAASLVAMISISVFDHVKIDDPVGAISVHGSAAILGLLLVPLTNNDAALSTQLLGTLVLASWGIGASFIVWKSIDLIMGLRVSQQEEYDGLDAVDCGVEAYPEFIGLPNRHQPESQPQSKQSTRSTSVWQEVPPTSIYRDS
jgi:ammonium transporter, Amt family